MKVKEITLLSDYVALNCSAIVSAPSFIRLVTRRSAAGDGGAVTRAAHRVAAAVAITVSRQHTGQFV